jgi:hypothetical protein
VRFRRRRAQLTGHPTFDASTVASAIAITLADPPEHHIKLRPSGNGCVMAAVWVGVAEPVADASNSAAAQRDTPDHAHPLVVHRQRRAQVRREH